MDKIQYGTNYFCWLAPKDRHCTERCVVACLLSCTNIHILLPINHEQTALTFEQVVPVTTVIEDSDDVSEGHEFHVPCLSSLCWLHKDMTSVHPYCCTLLEVAVLFSRLLCIRIRGCWRHPTPQVNWRSRTVHSR
jgi:hypothetical protein